MTATAVRFHVTHRALTEMRLVTTVALKRGRNHTPSHADCLLKPHSLADLTNERGLRHVGTLPALARFFSAFIVRCRDSPSHLEHLSPLRPRPMSAPFYHPLALAKVWQKNPDRCQVESPRGHGLLGFCDLSVGRSFTLERSYYKDSVNINHLVREAVPAF